MKQTHNIRYNYTYRHTYTQCHNTMSCIQYHTYNIIHRMSYTYTYAYTSKHAHTHAHTYTPTHLNKYTVTHVHTYTLMYVCSHANTRTYSLYIQCLTRIHTYILAAVQHNTACFGPLCVWLL